MRQKTIGDQEIIDIMLDYIKHDFQDNASFISEYTLINLMRDIVDMEEENVEKEVKCLANVVLMKLEDEGYLKHCDELRNDDANLYEIMANLEDNVRVIIDEAEELEK